ncbi:hypothetical protein AMTRI_Chr11g96920 [Amborella trichopoda]
MDIISSTPKLYPNFNRTIYITVNQNLSFHNQLRVFLHWKIGANPIYLIYNSQKTGNRNHNQEHQHIPENENQCIPKKILFAERENQCIPENQRKVFLQRERERGEGMGKKIEKERRHDMQGDWGFFGRGFSC